MNAMLKDENFISNSSQLSWVKELDEVTPPRRDLTQDWSSLCVYFIFACGRQLQK